MALIRVLVNYNYFEKPILCKKNSLILNITDLAIDPQVRQIAIFGQNMHIIEKSMTIFGQLPFFSIFCSLDI